ncbi:MAG: glycosyltransferase family 4 protein [Candidatus Hodarchaeota archaeon]
MQELSKYANITIISSQVEGTKSKEIINPNLRIYRFKPTAYLPKLPYTLDFLLIKRIHRYCKNNRCDVIIGYSLQFFSCFSAAIAAKACNIPFICRIVGASKTTNKIGIELISKLYDRSLAKITLKLAKKVLVQSKSLMSRPLELGLSPSKIAIVEDGIDFERFSQEFDRESLKRNLNITNSKVVISFISRLFELKGIEDLILVAKKILKEGENVLFLIAGTGSLEKKVKKITKNVENIIYLGYRKDVPNLLAISDIYVLPSYSEGLSPAILEAMASGLPVVTTRVGSNPDMFINGKFDSLIEPGDISNLKKILIKFIHDTPLRKELGSLNRKNVQENFDLKKTAIKFLAEIEKLLLI